MTRRKTRTSRRRTGNWKLKYAGAAAALLAATVALFVFRGEIMDAWQRKSLMPPSPVVKTIYKVEDRQKLENLFETEVK